MLKHQADEEDTMQTADAVRIEELTVRYGRNTILSNVNLSIPAGRMVGVMGLSLIHI